LTELHTDELHDLYFSSDRIRAIKTRRMRWARHVARTGKTRNAYKILVGNPDGKRAVRRRWDQIILKWILMRSAVIE
jgi:hypothetical protein